MSSDLNCPLCGRSSCAGFRIVTPADGRILGITVGVEPFRLQTPLTAPAGKPVEIQACQIKAEDREKLERVLAERRGCVS